VRQRRGRFEDADGGTLFLDEVAEMSPSVQAKLLRVLQERQFERVGSNRPIAVDVRIIAATRRDLEEEVGASRFRDDLYYRLKVVPIEIPPLRDRMGDVAVLVSAFARRISENRGEPFVLSPQTVRCLEAHPFPGNVRELENLVQRLAAVCPANTVLPEHLPEEYYRGCATVEVRGIRYQGSLADMMRAFESAILEQMMDRFAGNRGQIAQALGISRKSLWQKLKTHNLGE
jgi:two-component system nitrogen regulation response regulator NtrX